ncbi:MAG: lytic transglycosylase domain-containing protein [Rhodospirillales bacterium]|nr:lytic transglycosylase domain-containing protein [Rhodospirillales bacterium]
MSCHGEHATAARHAVLIETDAHRDLSYPYILRVADTPESGSSISRWQGFVAEAAQRFGIPPAWIHAVMRAESGGQATVQGRSIISPAGAIGLMQVMPETYAQMRRRHGLGPDPADPRDNILAGTAYLREMLDRFGYPHLFAAYNAGPARFDAYRRGEQPLPVETRAYLARVKADLSHPGDGPVPSSQSAPVEGHPAPDPLLFFPLGRRSLLFVEPHGSARPAEASRLDSAPAPARNRALVVSPHSTTPSPRDDQGPP